jgi:hypothetical protein
MQKTIKAKLRLSLLINKHDKRPSAIQYFHNFFYKIFIIFIPYSILSHLRKLIVEIF